MKFSTDAAQQHIDYNVWATRRLLDAVASLTPEQFERDFGSADKSIFGTLRHVLRSENGWVNRVQGNGQGASLPLIETLAQLRETWNGVHAQWQAFIKAATQSDLDGLCNYHDLKGNPWTNTLWEILIHVVNHSTHHRGQVAAFMRASGTTPPPLDYIAYVRSKNA
jgi:uncharacterized damage-inducible protein DinB